jgi:N-acetylmuramoyl-L-alanine amidase
LRRSPPSGKPFHCFISKTLVMSLENKFIIRSQLIPKPSRRRGGALISKVRFLVAHDTGNPGSTAAGNVKYYINSRNEQSASAHLFVDDKEIIECVPALNGHPEKAWHVLYGVPKDNELYGVNANDAAIGVEYCYGAGIDADKAYEKYVWLLAMLCVRFGLNPSKDIVGHFFLDPQRKTDPLTGLARSRRTYEQLLRDVAEEVQMFQSGLQPATYTVAGQQGSVITTVKLNLRNRPTTRGMIIQTLPPHSVINYIGIVQDGEAVNNNPLWYKDANGNFFWSGGVQVQTALNAMSMGAPLTGLMPDQKGIDFIKQREGLRLEAYKDSAGVWTIGYGSILYEDASPVRPGDQITRDRAEFLLTEEVNRKSEAVSKAISSVKLNQNQFDALVSFAYNVGVGGFLKSTLLKRVLTDPQDPTIRDAFLMWDKIHVDGELHSSNGLKKRRSDEADLYFS